MHQELDISLKMAFFTLKTCKNYALKKPRVLNKKSFQERQGRQK